VPSSALFVNLRHLNELTQIIADKIKRNGPISFAEYMSLALYHPRLGYYCSDRQKLGFSGDFYTSCTLTPAFGYAVAEQLLEMWRVSGIRDFTIIEYGAGTGDLCAAILAFFSWQNDLPGSLDYCIIEISPNLREVQQRRLTSNVRWVDDIVHISGFEGAVISNELIDNFPVHRVVMQEELQEIRVDYRQGLCEALLPASEELRKYFDDLKVKLPRGFKTEVCLAAGEWVRSIARAIRKGFVLTIDYGYLSGDLYSAERAGGTIVSYFHHQVVEDLYANIGMQDISAHVNFSALAFYGMHNGLLLTGFREQGPFLRALGFEQKLRNLRDVADPVAAIKKENVISQTILGDMGRKFKVLIQHKDLPQLTLKGFRAQGV
jgi:SAM-dependent MidA family methyltransferase